MEETVRSVNGRGTPDFLERSLALEEENEHLRVALETRVIIEQAKGAISARCNIDVDIAFEMLRGLARNQRRDIYELAAEVVENGGRFAADR